MKEEEKEILEEVPKSPETQVENTSESLLALFKPYEAEFQAEGLNEVEICRILLNLYHQLKTSPEETLLKLAEYYGVKLMNQAKFEEACEAFRKQFESEKEAELESRLREKAQAAALNLERKGHRPLHSAKGASLKETMASIFDQFN